jgi:hypothetical protein
MPKIIPEITLRDVTSSDVTSISISKSGNGLEVEVGYNVFTDGEERHHSGTIDGPLGAAASNEIRNWLENRVVPQINIQEGM